MEMRMKKVYRSIASDTHAIGMDDPITPYVEMIRNGGSLTVERRNLNHYEDGVDTDTVDIEDAQRSPVTSSYFVKKPSDLRAHGTYDVLFTQKGCVVLGLQTRPEEVIHVPLAAFENIPKTNGSISSGEIKQALEHYNGKKK